LLGITCWQALLVIGHYLYGGAHIEPLITSPCYTTKYYPFGLLFGYNTRQSSGRL
jgi:hypothetical protein